MKEWNPRRVAVILSMLLIGALGSPVAAQTNGTVTGITTDGSGASIPDANVTATNQETGLTRATLTGPDGGYRLVLLPPGVYRVTASKQGFQTAVRPDVKVDVNGSVRVDLSLAIGEITTNITVTGEPR